MSGPLRIGGLISGGGRTLLNLLDHIDAGTLPARVVSVISSRSTASGVERLRSRGVAVEVVPTLGLDATETQEAGRHDQIDRILQDAEADLVCLCGYLSWFRVGERWRGRVMNIHPALLPDFGGKGMYGNRVHRAVLESGNERSGCTVHLVDDQYDHGPVILQRSCHVLPGDEVDDLAQRVFKEECEAYPEAIRRFAAGLVGTPRSASNSAGG